MINVHGESSSGIAAILRRGQLERPDAKTMEVVQQSAAKVSQRPVVLAEAFYRHLFLLAPGVRSMFPADMTAQNEKLCRALISVVQALTSSDEQATRMENSLRMLGRSHRHHFAVRPEHYPYVGHALVRAVREVTGEWSAHTSSAWIWVYDWMSAHMLAEEVTPGRR